ncbi:MAG: chromosomal replication initiator protein DnaA [Acidobacteria bacterium]|nr:chromosomal replication initiator protein DnaA [Acidobacteriota bacterium]
MDLWEKIKERVAGSIPWESFESWFNRSAQLHYDGSALTVAVPSPNHRQWLETEYAPQVQAAIRDLKITAPAITYVIANVSPPAPAPAAAPAEPPADFLFGSPNQLNERYTFERFVVGSCNQLAHAAAQAVSEEPARAYNPLFIYGGVGMGKTHLIHAIGHRMNTRFPVARVVYTTAERFVNQLINCIKTDRMALFHQYYRSADVLLVDDVQVLAGKERTQEEFFHTFNELYDHQKQIVLSSDLPPKNIPNLVDRLRSRFEWGLMADVQAPDLETKLAILEKKAESENIVLPQDVRNFIANRTRSNVRELEGALVKLMASSSVTGVPIDIHMARQALRTLSGPPDKRVTIDAVIKATAERYGMHPHQLKHKSNQHQIAFPRQVAMYCAKELTQASLPEIGRAFGGKHHTTVLHSINKIDGQRTSDPDLNRTINSIMDSFH